MSFQMPVLIVLLYEKRDEKLRKLNFRIICPNVVCHFLHLRYTGKKDRNRNFFVYITQKVKELRRLVDYAGLTYRITCYSISLGQDF